MSYICERQVNQKYDNNGYWLLILTFSINFIFLLLKDNVKVGWFIGKLVIFFLVYIILKRINCMPEYFNDHIKIPSPFSYHIASLKVTRAFISLCYFVITYGINM